jgi:transposase
MPEAQVSAIRRSPSTYQRYSLWNIEDLFRRAKAILRTRPIYHSSDAAIRGHVFCSFLALMMQKELADLCQSRGLVIEWGDLLRDLDRLQEATIEKDSKRITTRTAVAGQVGRVFQAAGIALPPNLHQHTA